MSQVGPALFGLTGFAPPAGKSDFTCPLLNISQCHLTENNEQVRDRKFLECVLLLDIKTRQLQSPEKCFNYL
jgi:hypothetical protein